MIEKKEMKLSEKMEFGQAKEFENILYSVVLALEKHINVYGNIEDRTMNEKDKARADYIMALKQYWTSFYKLRLLTLYDFAKNQKIEY